jgi:hypothetical protein
MRTQRRPEIWIAAVGALLILISFLWSSSDPDAFTWPDYGDRLGDWALIAAALLWPVLKIVLIGAVAYSLAMWLCRAFVRTALDEIRLCRERERHGATLPPS